MAVRELLSLGQRAYSDITDSRRGKLWDGIF